MLADDFERRIGLRREGGRLVDPRPQNAVEVLGGELSPRAIRDAAKQRALAALRDYRNAGATRPDVWRVALSVLDDTTEAKREGDA
jgi:hypothetical protein